MNILRLARRGVLLSALLLGLGAIQAHADNFVVTNTSDSDGTCSSSSCSLREAIKSANADTTTADTITFADSVRGTIHLSGTASDTTYGTSAFILNGNVSILGPGADLLTLQRDSSATKFRFFLVSTGIPASISGLTLTGGNTSDADIGGAISNRGTLTLSRCLITNNLAELYGGALVNVGTMTIQDCTIANNTARGNDTSGGLDNNGSLTVTNSTFTGNATLTGGGNGSGGGIWTNHDMTISNSTITNNSVVNGASGIFGFYGNVTVGNSIIAANQNNASAPDVVSFGSVGNSKFVSSGYNLIGNVGGTTTFTATGDQTGTSSVPLDPKLGALQNNGGPTPTQALLTGSPAINAGDRNFATTNLPYDQRGNGFKRVSNTRLDIGAFEVQFRPTITSVSITPSTPTTNSTLTTTVQATGNSPTFTYQWQKNGVVLSGATGASLDLSKSGNGDKGDVLSVTVVAHDNDGDSIPLTSSGVTIRNTPPAFSGVTLTPAPAYTNSVLSATAGTISDADGDALTYSYQWSRNGVVIGNESGSSLDLGKAGNGDKGDKITLVMAVSDGSASVSRTSTLTINNSVPVLSRLTLSPSAPLTDDPLTATVMGSDADGEALTYTWTWTRVRAGKKSAVRVVSTSKSTDTLSTLGASVVVGDTITVSVVAKDGGSTSAPVSQSVVIGNSPISVVIVNYTPANPLTNDVIALNVRPSDLDKTPATYTYTWTKQSGGKSSVVQSTTSTSTYTTLNLAKAGMGNKGDVLTFTVSASDGQSSDTKSHSFTIANSVPQVTKLTLAPTSPSSTGVVIATFAASDPDVSDGVDTLTYTYKWRIGTRLLTSEKTSTLDLSKYNFVKPGDVVSLELRATDGQALSDAKTQSVTVAGNTTQALPPSAPNA